MEPAIYSVNKNPAPRRWEYHRLKAGLDRLGIYGKGPTHFLFSSRQMIAFDFGPKFELGRIVITRNALTTIPPEEVSAAIGRHSRGDWGELDAHDLGENARCLKEGGRLLSVHRAKNGVRFYVLTESDRSVTTVLLPEDY